jgi:adenylate cyclase
LIGWNIYLQQSKKVEPASLDKMAYPLPEKPSIAVLPFDNLSGDPKQDYLADGVTENIITSLALVPEMFVISRYSMFTYKGKPVKVQQVSEELGVRYVLEGSIQRSGDLVRITAQLIDALTGHHIWANHYDRDVKDLFNLLDEITKKITVELQVQLTHGNMARLWHKTDNFEAWGLAVRAWSLIENSSRENVKMAQELSDRAVQLDPMYAFAWSLLAYTHFYQAVTGWSNSPAESYKKAVSLNLKALEMDNTLWCATALLGSIDLFQGRFEEAIALGKKSIDLGPNIAVNYNTFAQTLFYAGRFEEAIAICKKGIRLQPYYPVWVLSYLGLSYRMTGRYDEALKIYNTELSRAKQGEVSPLNSHLKLADVYSELGEYKKARVHVDEVLKIDANYSLKSVRRRYNHFKDPNHLERIIESLRKVGLPDHS